MAELIERGGRVDMVTLTEQLQLREEIEAVGGHGYIASLTDGLPRVKNISSYTRIVKEKARARALVHVCNATQAAVCDGEKPDELLAGLQQDLINIFHSGRRARTPALPELARPTLDPMHQGRKMKTRSVGLTTGLAALDQKTTALPAAWLSRIRPMP